MKKLIRILIGIAIIAGVLTLAEFFVWQKKSGQPAAEVQNNLSTPQDETTAAEVSAPENNAENTPSPSPLPAADIAPAPSKSLPPKFLIDIPFYSQAPLGKWDAFHEEMCEEASILNAGLYLENKTLTKDQFEADLQKMQKIEKDSVGEWKSTTVAQTKKWAGVYFGDNLSIKIIDNPTVADIEAEVAAGHPVVVPLAGQDIGNQNFTPPGPVYHMLVVKGYDAVNFITNDVGTRKGNSYTYQKEVIMKNMHDWNAKNIHLGAKKVLVLYR